MTTHTTPFPAGTPCWADIMVRDLDRSRAFYRTLFGWEFTPSDPAYGGYCNSLLDGRVIAGFSPTMPGMEDIPPTWGTYFATDDIAATHAAAVAAGGTALMEPMNVAPFGWMCRWLDPQGNAFGAWQSETHTGYQAIEEAGSVAWTDHLAVDPTPLREFYGEVLGWSLIDIGGGYSLCTATDQETAACGIGTQQPGDDQPLGWSIVFQADDVDASAQLATESGGAITVAPYDFEFGRLAMVSGPDGEVFGLFAPAAAPEDA